MRVVQMSTYPKSNAPQQEIISMPDITEGGAAKFDLKKLIGGFEKDDYIIGGILALLIFEGCDDYILLAALGYLFVMGLI